VASHFYGGKALLTRYKKLRIMLKHVVYAYCLIVKIINQSSKLQSTFHVLNLVLNILTNEIAFEVLLIMLSTLVAIFFCLAISDVMKLTMV
jgi:hypothetical protein